MGGLHAYLGSRARSCIPRCVYQRLHSGGSSEALGGHASVVGWKRGAVCPLASGSAGAFSFRLSRFFRSRFDSPAAL
eukprot:2937532-Prymnesium_polylepis.1